MEVHCINDGVQYRLILHLKHLFHIYFPELGTHQCGLVVPSRADMKTWWWLVMV